MQLHRNVNGQSFYQVPTQIESDLHFKPTTAHLTTSTIMVQYDPFAPLFVNTDLPLREKHTDSTSGNTTPSLLDSPTSMNSSLDITKRAAPRSHVEGPAVHPQLRRLSSSHGSFHQYCSKCHMRRSSQDRVVKDKHDHSPEPELWDGFCPDIAMPTQDVPRPSVHHTRRHSGLCPESIAHLDRSESQGSPAKVHVKPQPCRHTSHDYHHECHCEGITPVDNLTERYGLVDEPFEMEIERRRSIEKQAMDKVADIMHEELIADMEARQGRL
ncbi:uncharacterized protein A1O9_12756 [Exophiala aquamarina CBS 119918]|uniref:Uncharacterized protein n=1 Tax=Exophiala aquamarina CBS 119918 TaxID=1182545 RepID=A0A072NUS4_9EURO|nr:uncharacterized protein A1O9_12756 [Exophiala aquamarina CBS 119918]KEF51142.1 hypothetical protein A1O9_12756 [Exophiala aquamarina CBS 119918]